ncbi:hypothetical protein DB346_23995 [Verrucomicrobia bacterium LW23]|nr:hypothetical protein DB346_23995 [Verrucomicrobia bacterium LW23]
MQHEIAQNYACLRLQNNGEARPPASAVVRDASAAVPPPTEREMQALWFERWFSGGEDCRVLRTEDGARFEVIQQGLWNHGPGPDFTQVCIRWIDAPEGSLPPGTDPASPRPLVTGSAELHLTPRDWEAHGHGADPAYEDVIVHVVWQAGPRRFYPATASFRRVPQVVLSTQLIAPWETLRPLLDGVVAGGARGQSGEAELKAGGASEHSSAEQLTARNSPAAPLPASRPGRCSQRLARAPIERIREVVHSAGRFRLEQKAVRWRWRARVSGREQALWEALAEGLGYSRNKLAFRLLAQRLPYAEIRRMKPVEASALLFGLAGMLPSTRVDHYEPEAREWLRERWEIWWRRRASLAHAGLPRGLISLAGVRPANRPERRLAALALLARRLPVLAGAVGERSSVRFESEMEALSDPFWNGRASLSATLGNAGARHALVGGDRIAEMLTNIYWPFVAMHGEAELEAAVRALDALPGGDNQLTRLARQRVLGGASIGELGSSALVQQGLLQIYHDYCVPDASACELCPFPELLEKWGAAGGGAGDI